MPCSPCRARSPPSASGLAEQPAPAKRGGDCMPLVCAFSRHLGPNGAAGTLSSVNDDMLDGICQYFIWVVMTFAAGSRGGGAGRRRGSAGGGGGQRAGRAGPALPAAGVPRRAEPRAAAGWRLPAARCPAGRGAENHGQHQMQTSVLAGMLRLQCNAQSTVPGEVHRDNHCPATAKQA